MYVDCAGGNEYGQCGEEPERKEDGTRALRRDIPIPQRCALKLKVRQVSGIGFIVPNHGLVLHRNIVPNNTFSKYRPSTRDSVPLDPVNPATS
jgi:hypothetical protein